MLKTSQMTGVAVYAPKGSGAKAGAFSRLGKVHMTVFAPDGRRVAGFLVGGVRVTKGKESYDDAARARLGIDWDACLLWSGMDAKTTDGKVLGYVNDASFNTKTGAVEAFMVGDGGMAQSLVGSVQIPVDMMRGYEDGFMLVDPGAARLTLSGGMAAKAGEGYAKAKIEGKKAAAKAGKAAGEAVDKGSRVLGKQLGRTKGMFSSFVDEFKKAQE